MPVSHQKVAKRFTGSLVPYDNEVTTVPGSFVDVITVPLAAGEEAYLQMVNLTCSQDGKMEVLAGTTPVGRALTAPGEPNIPYAWIPERRIVGPLDLKIRFRARAGTLPTEVSGHLEITQP